MSFQIKPLEWGSTSYGRPEVKTVVGFYRINEALSGGWTVTAGTRVLLTNDGRNNWPTIDAAKNAAQADYERRILSALPTEQAGERKPSHDELLALIRWAHDTLYEINPSNYDHDEVCKLNDASVEVILGLAPILGETHGKTEEWWAERGVVSHETPSRDTQAGLSSTDEPQAPHPTSADKLEVVGASIWHAMDEKSQAGYGPWVRAVEHQRLIAEKEAERDAIRSRKSAP